MTVLEHGLQATGNQWTRESHSTPILGVCVKAFSGLILFHLPLSIYLGS
jgi:hypothetical protein